MSIDTWEVYIKCPYCGKETTKYDHHENTSSDRSELFVILGQEDNSSRGFVCSCGKETPYNSIFRPEYCRVENLEKYKHALRRQIKFADRTNRVYFSDWAYDFGLDHGGEEPALSHLISLYPADEDLKKIKKAYNLLHTYGKKAVTKCEWNAKTVCRENILVPEALSKVYLGDNVEVIAPHTFQDCESLTDIFLPRSLKEIGEYAFANSDLHKVHTSDSLTYIGVRAFAHTWISRFFFPENIAEIGEECFADCVYLNNLWIPKQVIIGKNAFVGCRNLKSIQIHRSIPVDVVNTWGLSSDCVITWYDE